MTANLPEDVYQNILAVRTPTLQVRLTFAVMITYSGVKETISRRGGGSVDHV